MTRFIIVVFVVLLGLMAVGTILLGAFPPKAHRAPVEHVIPNDKFHAG